MRFVTADDSDIAAPMIASNLRRFGHEVVGHGFNGEEALKLCRELKPDVAMFDISMPRMNGDAAMRVVIAEGLAKHCVLATSQGQQAFIDVAKEIGASIMIKPYSPGQLKAMLESICEPHQ